MSNYKVKIIAVAKDEATYIPEWIFHHLYFKFDSIDIYINGTTDNTVELEKELRGKVPVSFINGDGFYNGISPTPQQDVYEYGFYQAKEAGFTHVLFIDIDEFWVPSDLSKDIHTCIENTNADIICFEWANKIENHEFSPAIEKNINYEPHFLLKSLINTNIEIQKFDIHNVISEQAKYALADGKPIVFEGKNQKLPQPSQELKSFFILHRMYRSELEYISLLATPIYSREVKKFKENRNGFCATAFATKNISFDSKAFEQYLIAKEQFLSSIISDELTLQSKDFIQRRFMDVINRITNTDISDLELVSRILTNVTNHTALDAYSNLLQKIANDISSSLVDVMRDSAIALEHSDIQKSYALMKFANKIRPKGPLISKKLAQYEAKLGIK